MLFEFEWRLSVCLLTRMLDIIAAGLAASGDSTLLSQSLVDARP